MVIRKRQQLTITIDPDIEMMVRKGARDRRISLSAYIEQALRAFPEVKRDMGGKGEQLELLPVPKRGGSGRPPIPKPKPLAEPERARRKI